MGNTENINIGDNRLRALLEAYLVRRSRPGTDAEAHQHLDEDALTAFVEGNLTSREADPMVAHMSDCSFCRHKTAELVRLDLAFAEMDEAPVADLYSEPSRVSEIVSGILSRLFGTGESAVFAHEEKKDEESESPKPDDESNNN
jgi:hypothetical protein